MERLLDFSLTISAVVFILKAFVFATGQDDSICQNVYLTANEGTITSPNYPSYYRSNLSCTWTINVSVNYCSNIEIHIADFDLQDRSHSGKCHYNFQIYDKIGKKQLTQLGCGQEPVENPLRTDPTTSHSVAITITSGDNIEGRGFNITYKTVQPQEDNLIFVDERGTIVVEEQHCSTRWTLYNNTDQPLAAVQFDPSKKIFYIFATREKVISRYELIGWREELRFKDDIVTDDIENVTSIVVDSVNERLYWSDASLNTISTSRLDGSQRRDLFTSDVVAPCNLLLGPECRYIYWTNSRRGSSTIERAFVNGTSRENDLSEKNNGSFVLAIAGQTLYRIMTLTGTLRQYNLSQPFLARARNRDDKFQSLRSATSAIKTNSYLLWSADSKTYVVFSNRDKLQVDVYILSGAPPSSQLLYYTKKNEPSASSCAPFDEPPLEGITTDRSTKASSSTENSEELQTSSSTYITNPPRSTVPTTLLPRAVTSEKTEQIKTSLSTYITDPNKSTVPTTLLPRAVTSEKTEQIKTSLSTYITDPNKSTVPTTLLSRAVTSEKTEQIKTSLSTYITDPNKSTVPTTLLSRAVTSEKTEQIKASLSKYITNSNNSTVPTTLLPRAGTLEKSEQIKTSLSTYITNPTKSTVPTTLSLWTLLPRAVTSEKSEQMKTPLSTNITKYPKSTVVTTLLTLKDPKSVSSNPSSHHANLQFWHVLLVLVLAMIICLGLLFASIKYKRSMSRSFHLPYPDKITFKLLEKQPQSFSTNV